MNKYLFIEKYIGLLELIYEKEVILEIYIEKWLNGQLQISIEELEDIMTTTRSQILLMKTASDHFLLEFKKAWKDEILESKNFKTNNIENFIIKNEAIINSKNSLYELTNSKNNIYISEDDLEVARKIKMLELKEKIINQEIGLEEAYNIKKKIENTHVESEKNAYQKSKNRNN